MHIGIPREIKPQEHRVALTPAGARQLVEAGHRVSVETHAGVGAGFDDDHYRAAGAQLVATAVEAYTADLIVKVKEPQAPEIDLLRPGQLLFCYLHLAANLALARALLSCGVCAIAYETVRDVHGRLPLLAPMSDIAGRLAPQAGALGLHTVHGGKGMLIGGLPGVAPAHVLIIGAGAVGLAACRIASGLGARVSVLDRHSDALARVEGQFGARIETGFASIDTLAGQLAQTDIVIGAAQIPGRHAPRLITRELLSCLRPGSVLVDVAIDQGGIAESSRPTSHAAPYFVDSGIVHYGVANMPGAVPRTATLALTQATLPWVARLADEGRHALDQYPELAAGLQLDDGQIRHPGLAEELRA